MVRAAMICTFLALAACETTEGLGHDVSNLGDEISQEARAAQ
ncbi:entericidin [Tropicimonas sp. S265A]